MKNASILGTQLSIVGTNKSVRNVQSTEFINSHLGIKNGCKHNPRGRIKELQVENISGAAALD